MELEQGAVSHGFPDHIWTRSRVNALIVKLFSVSYDPTQVGRILKKVGWNGPPLRPAETRQKGANKTKKKSSNGEKKRFWI